MVKYDKLFNLLTMREVQAVDIRALLDLYSRQTLRTIWQGKVSRTFRTTNGIRQGAIASPVLFCIYMNALLERLRTNGDGCWIGPYYAGAVCYTDDLTLMCPTIGGLRTYPSKFQLMFLNPNRSNMSVPCNIQIDNGKINGSNEVSLLGITIDNKLLISYI